MTGSRWIAIVFVVLLWGGALTAGWGPEATAQDRGTPLFGPPLTPDTVAAAPYDTGRLWSLASLPHETFRSQYALDTPDQWRQQLQRGVVRLPNCSGGLVSPQGLVLTAARCVRPHLAGEGQATDAFLADAQADERRLPGVYADRVVDVRDVTSAVQAAREEGTTTRREARRQVERERQGQAGSQERVEVVAEDTSYTAYTYRRYDDVRLVFLPEASISQLGGAEQGFAYPQHAWGAAVLRVYAGGRPIQSPEAFALRSQGARPGDLVFAAGVPENAQRAGTAAQAAFDREVWLPARRQAIATWVDSVAAFGRGNEMSDQMQSREAQARSTLARLDALQDGLQNAYFQRILRRKDSTFVAMKARIPRAERRALIDSIETLQREKRAMADSVRAFSVLRMPAYSSASLQRAAMVVGREGDGASLDSIRADLQAIPAQPRELDAALLTAHLRHISSVLDGQAGASQIHPSRVDRALGSSALRSDEAFLAALQNGGLSPTDSLVQMLEPVLAAYHQFRDGWEALAAREQQLVHRLTRQRAQIDGRPVVQPQGRSLRVADGRLQGYPDNGTIAPPFTTFYGLYAQSVAHASQSAWELPDRWQGPPSSLSLPTPLVSVASTDIGGGMPGGVLLNESLQVVGLVTGGNVQSAAGEYAFLPDRMRAVSLDVQGLLEGLRSVYAADALVNEMTRRTSAAAPPPASSE